MCGGGVVVAPDLDLAQTGLDKLGCFVPTRSWGSGTQRYWLYFKPSKHGSNVGRLYARVSSWILFSLCVSRYIEHLLHPALCSGSWTQWSISTQLPCPLSACWLGFCCWEARAVREQVEREVQFSPPLFGSFPTEPWFGNGCLPHSRPHSLYHFSSFYHSPHWVPVALCLVNCGFPAVSGSIPFYLTILVGFP